MNLKESYEKSAVVKKIIVSNDFKKGVEERYREKLGYLCYMENIVNKARDEIELEYNFVRTIFQKKIEKYEVDGIFEFEDENIMLYSTSSLELILKLFRSILDDEKIANEFRYRISISIKGNYFEHLIANVEKIVGLFDKNEYNTIRVGNVEKSYIRAENIKKDVTSAISKAEFQLYFQSIANINSIKIDGIEILIRWRHKKYGLIGPGEFIPYAESTGLIVNIDLFVIKSIFEEWIRDKVRFEKIKIHVNISIKTLKTRDFYELIQQYEAQIDYSQFVFELTERTEEIIDENVLDQLQKFNLVWAIDDFGTGYSNLDRFRKNYIRCVKFDKSFIANLVESTNDVIIFQNLLSMCRKLKKEVIIEGVESVEQLRFLENRGAESIQGFIFSYPKNLKYLKNGLIDTKNLLKKYVQGEASFSNTKENNSKPKNLYIQDILEDGTLINPNVPLLVKLNYLNEEEYVNFKMLIDEKYLMYFEDRIQRVKRGQNLATIICHINDIKNNSHRVMCAVQKEDNIYRIHIEFLKDLDEIQNTLMGLSHSYIQMFEESPAGIIVVDDDFQVNQWNNSSALIFGYIAREAKSKSMVKLVTKDAQETILNKLLNDAISYERVEAVIQNTTKFDEKIYCRWHVKTIYDEINAKYNYICIVNDITEELKHDRERIRVNKALDQSESIIIMTDIEGRIEYVNQKFVESTGYEKHEVMGALVDILSAKRHNKDYFLNLWETIKIGKIWSGEFENIRKNGEHYWCQAKIYPIKELGKVTGFVSVQWDTTEAKQLANRNESLRNKLFEQDKIASLGLLTSGILHEINNPLGYIQSNVGYLVDILEDIDIANSELKNEIKETLDDIDTGVNQVRKIASSFKKYLFKGKEEEKQDTDIIELIKEVLLLSKNEYKYNASCKIYYEKDVDYTYLVYSSKLKQVIMNLIINASHAIIRKDSELFGEIKVEIMKNNGNLEISISDNGCGMNEEIKKNIFEPFFTTKGEGVGTGLGLSVSKQIIEEDHKGKLLCESEEGVGTTFYIRL